MSEINTLKLSNLNDERKSTFRSLTGALSQVNEATKKYMKQQAYMLKNPDANGAGDLVAFFNTDFDAAYTELLGVYNKLKDMYDVRNGVLDVDTFISRHGIDLTTFSNELI